MTDERFLELHSMYMTRHYRTALYLLGDREKAVEVAEQSWLHCCLQMKGEDRAFHLQLCKELLALCCPLMDTVQFLPDALLPNGQGNRAAACAVGALSVSQRLVLSLCSIARCEPEQVAQLLDLTQPEVKELLTQATDLVLGRKQIRAGV